jgi:hypothetical protein
VALESDPGTAGEVLGQPRACGGRIAIACRYGRAFQVCKATSAVRGLTASGSAGGISWNPKCQAIRHAAAVPAGKVGARQVVAALLRAAPAQRDQRREVAVAGAILRQQHQLHAAGELQLGAVDQLQPCLARREMGAHAAGEAAFVGDRQRRVAQFRPGAPPAPRRATRRAGS